MAAEVPAAAPVAADEAKVVAPPAPVKVTIGDPSAVKHAMDEHVALFFIDELGYEDDVTLSNIKLTIGFGAVLVALLAQFYPKPFPESKDALILLVGLYWILHAAVQCMHWVTDSDAVLITKPKRIDGPDGPRRSPALALRTEMKQSYDTSYTMTLSYREASRSGNPARAKAGSYTASVEVTDFFDTNGVFVKEPFNAQMHAFVHAFHQTAKLD